jgi:hypothetical protein
MARRKKQPENTDDWVPLTLPDNFDEIIETMNASTEERIGWCFLCNGPVRGPEDLISGTSTHRCPNGLALEEKIAKDKR